jgi:predicted amidohydrolase
MMRRPSPSHVLAALVQLRTLHGNRSANIERASEHLASCKRSGVGLVCLPAAFATGLSLADLRSNAECIPGGTITTFIREQARELGAFIIAGILERDGGDIFDSAVLVSPQGEVVERYRRWFLWRQEKAFLAPGAPASAIRTPFGTIGITIGYDLSFPEAFRRLFLTQADLIVCLANTFSGLARPVPNWARARAAENHCYFLLCSGLGFHPFVGDEFMGESMVTCDPIFAQYELFRDGPDADVIAQAGQAEQVLYCPLHLATLARRRDKVPEYADLRDALAAPAAAVASLDASAFRPAADHSPSSLAVGDL